jgi:F-type H+-transporting ATPase subunit b
MSDLLFLIAAEGAHAAAEAHAEPAIAGIFNATVVVSLAMLVLIGIMLWAKVPSKLAGSLDARIAEIRKQLDEASALRAEAEALRGEYDAKLKALEAESAAMRERAQQEASSLIARAEEDATALVARRQKMAEDRIAAAERQALSDVRDTASRVAVGAARSVIADGHSAAADKSLVDRAITEVAKL